MAATVSSKKAEVEKDGPDRRGDTDCWEKLSVRPDAPRHLPTAAVIVLGSGPLLLLAASLSVAAAVLLGNDSHWAAPVFIVAAFALVAAIIFPLGVMADRRAQLQNEEDCFRECQEWSCALEKITNPTIQRVATVNFKQLRKHVKIAQGQVRHSFWASLGAATIALLVLAVGMTATLVSGETNSKIAGTVLTSAGLALSGFLTATFVKTYQVASRQMSYYYGQPLVHCYLLQSEWLADVICGLDRTEGISAWRAVLDEALQSAKKSQDHLLDLTDHAHSRKSHNRARSTTFSGESGALAALLAAVGAESDVSHSNGRNVANGPPVQESRSQSE